MKKGKTFDYYLQEALRELEKPCEEFNAARCERLLQNCVNTLLQGEYSLREDINGNAVKEEFQSTGKVAQYPKSQLIVFTEKFQSPGGYSHGKTIVFLSSTSHNRSCSSVRNGFDGSCNGVFTACSSVFSPCRLTTSRGRDADSPYGRFHSHFEEGVSEKVGFVSISGSSGVHSGTFLNSNSRAVLGISSDTGSFGSVRRSSSGRSGKLFSGLLSQDRKEGVSAATVFHSFVGCPAFSIGSAGSNGSFRTDRGSSPLGSRRLVPDKADKSITLGRFHSNPPKGELNEKQGKACEDQRLFTVAVEIDSLSGETVQVKADSPEKALAEALQKLTPGVKTVVWGEE